MERILKVSDVPFSEISNNERKKLKLFKGPLALIKQLLIETSAQYYTKSNLSVLGIVRFK
jgi:hypothetical protein